MNMNHPMWLRLRELMQKEWDLLLSRAIAVDDVSTVCIFLGPNRNLTTLTASILFLHPHCQVLNHAGVRVLGDDRVDFLRSYSPRKLRRFLQFAIRISRGGSLGWHGGSITRSHAFGRKFPKMRATFRATRSLLAKEAPRTIVWKEAQAVTKYILKHGIQAAELLNNDDRLRFMLPVRNPLDCAASYFRDPDRKKNLVESGATMEETLTAVLDRLLWVIEIAAPMPDRLFHFFEHSFNEETLRNLANFLRLDPSPDWLQASLEAIEVKSDYSHPAAIVDFYKETVQRKFTAHPEFMRGLMRFGDRAEPASR